jgi:hypothetical protein
MSLSHGGYYLDCRTDAATENPDFRTLQEHNERGCLGTRGALDIRSGPCRVGSTRGGVLLRGQKGGAAIVVSNMQFAGGWKS